MPVVIQPGVATPGYSPHHSPPVNGSNLGALEYLATLDQLFVKRNVELYNAASGHGKINEYDILDAQGRRILFGIGDPDCLESGSGPMSPFDMTLLDGDEQGVMHLVRPLACYSCCCPCCLQSIQVQAPPGNAIGKVEQKWSIINPEYCVKDTSGRIVYHIEGPFCTSPCCASDAEFKIYSDTNKSQQVGRIWKKWSGCCQEFHTDAENAGMEFPPGADPTMKAVLIGAYILIDYISF